MKKYIATGLIFLLSVSAFAQIVNVEKKRKKTDGFQATVSLDFNVKETGKRILELKNNIDLQYAVNAHTFIFLNSIKLLNIDRGSFINNGFQHLRYNYTLQDTGWITIEAFGQYQYNEQKLLQQRIISGLGPRFRIINQKRTRWYFAPLLMYEYEHLDEKKIDTTTARQHLIRLDSYTHFDFALNDIFSFDFILYFQPAFENFKDLRISGEASIRFKITDYLSYKIAYSADYDSDPPAKIQNTFWRLSNQLIFKI